MADSALTEAECRFLAELNHLGVRFLLVGASAAVLQGANTATQDLDLWFEAASKRATGRPRDLAQIPALEEALAASED